MIILGIFLISLQIDTLWVLISEALLMSTHNICFYGELEETVTKLSPNTPS